MSKGAMAKLDRPYAGRLRLPGSRKLVSAKLASSSHAPTLVDLVIREEMGLDAA
jgi:hypothetical protein